MSQIIIGTAGHIDHGKTALVRALTGVDTDRLKEEKARGLTIDLGFAHLDERATIIDVPGHEKFIRNMVAGVSTIDLVLFVVAADDGVMPQTREHLDILKILQVKQGLIVITKRDLVADDWLQLVKEDVQKLVKGSFLENAPIIMVSAITKEGIPELQEKMNLLFPQIIEKKDRGVFWMPIDRVFTKKGFGTVVTGSVLSGQVNVGDNLELLPQKEVIKVRGLHSHDRSVKTVFTSDRAAINLQSIEKQDIHRGDVLAAPGYAAVSQRFDAKVKLLPSAPRALKSRMRVRLHFGTSEVMARISLLNEETLAPGESGFVQFHLERQGAARRLDPFVIRQYSPMVTIGGGIILDANAHRHKKPDVAILEKLQALERDDPSEVLVEKLLAEKYSLLTVEQLSSQIATSKEEIATMLDELVKREEVIMVKKKGQNAVIHKRNLEAIAELIQEKVTEFHQKNPIKIGIQKSELQKNLRQKTDPELFEFVLEYLKKNEVLKETAGLIGLEGHELTLSDEQQKIRERIARRLYDEAFATSSETELADKLNVRLDLVHDVLSLMFGLDEVVRLEGGIYLHPQRIAEGREKVIAFLKQNQEITVSQFKDLLHGTSRKYAVPLLNYFDGLGITERVGDVRVLGKI